MKKATSLVLALVMCFSLSASAFANNPDDDHKIPVAYTRTQLEAELERGAEEIIVPIHNNVSVEIREIPLSQIVSSQQIRD